MTQFENALMLATKNIANQYFSTEIIQGNPLGKKSVYRERIYCYELYHQIRLLWDSVEGGNIFGEYDKSGSSFYAGTGLQRVKPDFLIHLPGNTENNHIAMEVKSSTVRRPDIQKDIKKLIKLTDEHGFRFGVYLIYGKNAAAKGNIANECIDDRSNIKIFIHNEVGVKAFPLDAPQATV